MPETINIILADDHQIILDGLVTLLSGQEGMNVLETANTGKEAIGYARQLQPDVIVMDLNMPEMNGMVAAREIKSSWPSIKVIILSLHAEKAVIQHMMEAGVDGYVIKTAAKDQVIQAIREVSQGKKYFSSDVAMSLSGFGPASSSLPDVSSAHQQQLALLSSREIEVLKLIADGHTNREIGEALHLSPRTIDAHRANIMQKLDIHKVTGLVRFAVKAGVVD